MIVVMKLDAAEGDIERVKERLNEMHYRSHVITGVERIVIGAVGDKKQEDISSLTLLPGVEKLVPVMAPYKLVSREVKKERSLIDLGDGVVIGGKELIVMAGPCAVEGSEMLLTAAEKIARAGAKILRGGAFKPRTSPYSFQGLEEEGLKILAKAREKTGLKVVTEVINPQDVELVSLYADILQVGARNMQNYALLRELGKQERPILLKRGLAATIEEWLMAAEYILAEGNYHVILCERGIRTFEQYTRNTLDISSIPLVKSLSHLPIVVDPSHSGGKRKLVPALSRAAVAAGADGLLIEVHPLPETAYCDGPQSLTPEDFRGLMEELRPIAEACGRNLAAPGKR
jgi:3-deoxy-7-phosphoheptulonate synthase